MKLIRRLLFAALFAASIPAQAAITHVGNGSYKESNAVDAATGVDDGFNLKTEVIPWLNSADWDYFSDVTFPNSGGSLNDTNWATTLMELYAATPRPDQQTLNGHAWSTHVSSD